MYIISLSNGAFYTGYTDDIDKRMKVHVSGKGSKIVRAFKPVRFERVWKVECKSDALKIEARIKRMKREEKVRLVGRPSNIKKISAQLSLINVLVVEEKKYSKKNV